MLKIFDITVRYPRLAAMCAMLFALFFIAFIPRVKVLDNVDYFNVDDDDARYYEKFKEQFGNDEFFVVAMDDDALFTPERLETLKKVTQEIEAIEEVREVKSLANIDSVEGGRDIFEVKEFLEDIPRDPPGLAKLKADATSDPLYRENLVSPDGRSTGILVYTYDRKDDQAYRKRLIGKVNEVLEKIYPGKGYRLAGWTVTNFTLSQILRKDMSIFVPLAVFMVCAIIHLIFRRPWVTLLATINIGACLVSTFGLFGLLNITFNNLTCVVLPLAVTLSLADTIHILSHLDKRLLGRGQSDAEVLSGILKSLVKPCLLTSLTTAAGFLSLATSRLGALADFAYTAAAAMLFEFTFSFFLIPPLILLMGAEKFFSDFKNEQGMRFARGLERHYEFVRRNKWPIVLAGAVITMTGAYLTFQVRVETNVLKYFWPSSELIQSVDFVEARLGGVQSINVSLQAEEEDFFKRPDNLRLIEEIANYAKTLEGVDVVLSLSDLVKEMNKSFNEEQQDFYRIPETENQVAQYLLLYDGEELEEYIDSSFAHARILIRSTLHGTKRQKVLIRQLDEFMQEKTRGMPIKARLTGQIVNFVNVSKEMVDGQISSFGTATVVVGVIMILLLKSLSLGLLSLVPNIFPIVVNFGVMGLFDIPLDTGTVMIASVALGIAVDDTVHFLMKYRALRREGKGVDDSLREVVIFKGRAILASAVILAVGFGVLVFGNFVPVVNFGELTAVVMVSAIAGDLLLLPAIMLLRQPTSRAGLDAPLQRS